MISTIGIHLNNSILSQGLPGELFYCPTKMSTFELNINPKKHFHKELKLNLKATSYYNK